jgi:hypothetical protein
VSNKNPTLQKSLGLLLAKHPAATEWLPRVHVTTSIHG